MLFTVHHCQGAAAANFLAWLALFLDSFGKLTASSGTLTNPIQYTSREFDPETGLLNYRARYYDPTIGRLISEDPIGFHAGVNFYDYVLNRPTVFLDPTGLAGGPYGSYEKTRSWGSKIKCAIYLIYCTKKPARDA
jgi:RHS repeat-associated protein